MRIDASGAAALIGPVDATLDAFRVPPPERDPVVAFIESTRPDIVEV